MSTWYDDLKKILLGGLPAVMDFPGANQLPEDQLKAQYAEQAPPVEPSQDLSGPSWGSINPQYIMLGGLALLGILAFSALLKR